MRLDDGSTIIHFARNPDHVKKFLYLGYDVNTRNSICDTPLHIAARYRNLDLIKALISSGANVNAENSCGITPLIIAISYQCDMQIIHELLKAGSDYSTVMNYFKEKVMHTARTGELVKEFSRRGAKVDLKDSYGYTPLHRASRNRSSWTELSTAQELIRLGADVNCRDDNGKTPLYHSILGERYDVMVELITNGAEVSDVISDRSFPTGRCTALDKAFKHQRMMGRILMKHVLLRNWAKEEDFTNFKQYLLNPYQTYYVEDYAYKCIYELFLMKTHKIDNYFLLDIIKTQIPYLRKPLNIDYEIKEDIDTIFPIYSDLISTIVETLKKRRSCFTKIRQKMKHNNISLGSKDISTDKSVVLNFDCVLMICEYLSHEDLTVFLSAWD